MTEPPGEQTRDLAKYVVVALSLAVAAVAVFVVFFNPSDTPAVSYRVLSLQLGDPEQVVVRFEVTKAPLAEAECVLTATGPDREIVNRLSGVRIGPSPGERTTRHTATIPTDQRATDAAIATCTITRTR